MDTLLPILVALLGLLLLVALVGWWRSATRIRRRNGARQRIALAAEGEAEHLLERAGFTVVERQVTQRFPMWVDGEPIEAWCRADLIVTRRGRAFVAEVKTGTHAPDPTKAATRRQLREYAEVFEVDGVLLVDMVAREIRSVAFSADA